jgi:hypothetical protein
MRLWVFALLGISCAVAGCESEPPAGAQTVAALQQSKSCRSQVPFQFPESTWRAQPMAGVSRPATIEMSNDGGWCWFGYSVFLRGPGGGASAAYLRINNTPAHGQVTITRMQQSTRVAYKPDSGFTGADAFSFSDRTTGMVRRVDVSVTE